ncbi:LysR family transcriptional regulator [Polaromonas sp. OV174]|uniref:LysR family transcriptional regulator n=1 Tax=Polaromonas sp. OV174 TaxID=1855300 RepID=UPI000B87DD5F|nr:LysR family transcriptional regulator [Polaromonas sp. OV174]
MDTLELIRTFREVAARGGFSRAATALEVSKANVSKYVAELESRLGARLLNRSTRTVSLTDAGKLLLERSTPLLEMMALTRDELLHRSQEPSGRLRMTAPQGIGSVELPDLLADFMRRYPEVHISLKLSNRVLDMVEDGMDLALRIGITPDPNLIVRKLRQVNLVVCATPAYWQQHGRPSHPDELADHDALTLSLFGTHPEWRFKVNGKSHSVALRSRMDASDPIALLQMALQGMGVARLPQLMVQSHLDSGALQAVLVDHRQDDLWLYAAYTQRRHNSAALKALLAFIEERWKVE